MSRIRPKTSMVLAAGMGMRMRPITDNMPKPLVRVFGKPLIDHGLDALANVGVNKAVVNVHHFGDQMESHLKLRDNPTVVISDERELLMDSGGGIVKALPQLGNEPFFLMNADSFWLEGSKPNLELLGESWRDDKMDMLLLLSGICNSTGYNGKGDFTMDTEGRLVRRAEREIAPFAYCGAAIIHPRIFASVPNGPFSLNLLFDRAIENERLYGVLMGGMWLHVGTPEAINEAEMAIAMSAA